MEVTIYEGLGRYDVIYREIGIHGKYAKKYYFYVILLHQCICVCCLNVGEGLAWKEIKHNIHSNLEEVCFCGSIKYRDESDSSCFN